MMFFSEKKIHLFSGHFSNATQETSWKAQEKFIQYFKLNSWMNVTNKIFKFWGKLFEFNFSREGSELLQLGLPNS